MRFSNNKIALATLVALSLTACSPNKNSNDYINSAKSYIAKGKSSEAIIDLKNAVRISPKNSEIRGLLGQVYLDQGLFKSAEKEFSRAFDLTESLNESYLLSLLQSLVSQDDKYNTVTYIEENRELLNSSDIANSYYYWATNGEKRLSQAIISTLSAKAFIDGYRLSLDGSFEESAQQFEQAAKDAHSFGFALFFAGNSWVKASNYNKAINSFQRYLSIKPNDKKVKLFLAYSYVLNDLNEKALPIINLILKSMPKQPFANYLLGVIQFKEKKYAEAIDSLKLVEANGVSNSDIKLLLAMASYQLNNFEQAYNYFNLLKDIITPSHPAYAMSLMTRIQLGYEDEALSIVEKSNFDQLSQKDLIRLTSEFALKGEVDLASSLIENISQEQNLSSNSLEKLGVLKLILGDSSAIETINNSLAQNPNNFSMQKSLIAYYLKQQKFDLVASYSQKYSEQTNVKNERITWLNVLGNAYFRLKKDKAATKVYQLALTEEPTNIASLLYLSREAIKQQNWVESERLLKNSLAIKPENIKALFGYYIVITKQQSKKKALNFLQEAVSSYPQNHKILELLGAVLSTEKDYNALENVLVNNKLKGTKSTTYWKLLLKTQYAKKNKKGIEKVLTDWQIENPRSVAALKENLFYYESKGNYKKCLELTDAVSSYFSNSLNLKLTEAAYLIRLGKLEEAESLLLKYRKSSDGKVESLLGRIYLRKGKQKQAIENLEYWYEKSTNERSVTALVSAYIKSNKIKAAQNLLTNYLVKHPSSIFVRKQLAQIYLPQSPIKALAEWEIILSKTPKDYTVLNNIAWIYYQEKKYAKGIKYAKRAFELMPNSSSVIHTYGMLVYKSLKDSTKAKALLKRAFDISPNNKTIKADLESMTKQK